MHRWEAEDVALQEATVRQQAVISGIVNVASVPQRSPFRYPGGKTWLIPRVRQWLRSYEQPPRELIEPFAGGSIVSLTAVFEDLVGKATIIERDADIASVWHTVLKGQGQWLADRIASFQVTPENVKTVLDREITELRERAFATILRNRISRGGILAPGAGIVKNGENGKGLTSRWYPETLRKRIVDIIAVSHRIFPVEGDGISHMRDHAGEPGVVFFIDPPYVVAGRRLYTHCDVDHEELFRVAASLTGDFLMTYDKAPEILHLADKHKFEVREVAMKNTHHACKTELLISRNLTWMGS